MSCFPTLKIITHYLKNSNKLKIEFRLNTWDHTINVHDFDAVFDGLVVGEVFGEPDFVFGVGEAVGEAFAEVADFDVGFDVGMGAECFRVRPTLSRRLKI